MRAPALKPDQTMALLREYAAAVTEHGAQSAPALAIRNRIVAGNLGLVFMVWKAHARRQVPYGDVLGIGAQGLIKAVERFDLTHGVRFATYAAWWIRHVLSRTAANERHTIRVPVHAQTGGARKAQCRDAADAARRVRSLDVPMAEDSSTTFGAMLPDAEATAAVDAFEADDQHTALARALARLPEPQRRVAELRSQGWTLAEVAAALGVSREHARQLESQAYSRLRRAFRAA